jgi:hypothetical protein
MGAFIAAWLTGEGIIIYRSVKEQKAPPGPGQLLLSSGVFVMLALLAEAKSAKPLATTLAWGFVTAAWLNIGNIGNKKTKSTGKWPPAPVGPYTIIPTGNSAFDTIPGNDLGSGQLRSVTPKKTT